MGEFLARNAEALVRSIGVHLFYTLVSVAIGFVLGLGLGILLSRFPRQARFILPLLSLFNTIPGVVFIGLLFLVLHIQPATVLIALSIYAMFPVLKNTFTGLLWVDTGGPPSSPSGWSCPWPCPPSSAGCACPWSTP